eukprot:symbB.v1.2.005661.t1/scaffold327.1/size259883/14
MVPIKDKDALSSELCLPAWSAKVVSRADQAWFETTHITKQIVIYNEALEEDRRSDSYGNSPCVLGVTDLGGLETKRREAKTTWLESVPHVVIEVKINCLTPVSNLKDRLQKDLEESKKQVEKNIRTWIAGALKAKSKTVKKKGKKQSKDASAVDAVDVGSSHPAALLQDQGLAGKDAEKIFEAFGMELPKTKEEQVSVLQGLLAEDAHFEELIVKAKEAVVLPSFVPLTKLTDDGSKTASRAKLMQEALSAAMGVGATNTNTGGDRQGQADFDASHTKFGLQAA